MSQTRREFLVRTCRGLVEAAAVPAAGLWLSSCVQAPPFPPMPALDLDVRSLTSQGDFIVTQQTGPDKARILIVRTTGDRFLAMSMRCTHQGCPVGLPIGGVLTCPCHGSQYDLQGKVLHGPTIFALGRYATTYDAETGHLTVNFAGYKPPGW